MGGGDLEWVRDLVNWYHPPFHHALRPLVFFCRHTPPSRTGTAQGSSSGRSMRGERQNRGVWWPGPGVAQNPARSSSRCPCAEKYLQPPFYGGPRKKYDVSCAELKKTYMTALSEPNKWASRILTRRRRAAHRRTRFFRHGSLRLSQCHWPGEWFMKRKRPSIPDDDQVSSTDRGRRAGSGRA